MSKPSALVALATRPAAPDRPANAEIEILASGEAAIAHVLDVLGPAWTGGCAHLAGADATGFLEQLVSALKADDLSPIEADRLEVVSEILGELVADNHALWITWGHRSP